MAFKRSQSAENIRYYIYGLLQKNPDFSVRIPSSYELAEMFHTTRRIAQYEMERLTNAGVLIARHRVGTYTNPRSNAGWHMQISGKRLMIGMAYGNGNFFSYSYPALQMISGILRGIAQADCCGHIVHFSEELDVGTSLCALPLSGLLWASKMPFPSEMYPLIRKVAEHFPVVCCGSNAPAETDSLSISYTAALRELRCRLKGNRPLKVLLLQSMTEKILPEISGIVLDDISTQEIPAIFSRLEERFKAGCRPDLCLCEDGFLEPLQRMLEKYNVNWREECRIATLFALSPARQKDVFSLSPDFDRMGEMGMELLLRRRNNPNAMPEHRIIEAEIQETV